MCSVILNLAGHMCPACPGLSKPGWHTFSGSMNYLVIQHLTFLFRKYKMILYFVDIFRGGVLTMIIVTQKAQVLLRLIFNNESMYISRAIISLEIECLSGSLILFFFYMVIYVNTTTYGLGVLLL